MTSTLENGERSPDKTVLEGMALQICLHEMAYLNEEQVELFQQVLDRRKQQLLDRKIRTMLQSMCSDDRFAPLIASMREVRMVNRNRIKPWVLEWEVRVKLDWAEVELDLALRFMPLVQEVKGILYCEGGKLSSMTYGDPQAGSSEELSERDLQLNYQCLFGMWWSPRAASLMDWETQGRDECTCRSPADRRLWRQRAKG